MSSLTEKLHASGFILSEGEGSISRDNGILLSGQNLGAGAVLGKTCTAGTITGAPGAGNTGGSGGISALTVGGGAQPGVYRAVCVEPAANAGAFELFDPSGVLCGRVTVAVAFTGEINFTIADATDFVSGDFFEITVSQLTYKYKVLNSAGTDGSQRAAGILIADVDASAADVACPVLSRLAEVNANELVYPGGITAAQKDIAIAQLTALGIVVRS